MSSNEGSGVVTRVDVARDTVTFDVAGVRDKLTFEHSRSGSRVAFDHWLEMVLHSVRTQTPVYVEAGKDGVVGVLGNHAAK
jgi:hypothetical protein